MEYYSVKEKQNHAIFRKMDGIGGHHSYFNEIYMMLSIMSRGDFFPSELTYSQYLFLIYCASGTDIWAGFLSMNNCCRIYSKNIYLLNFC